MQPLNKADPGPDEPGLSRLTGCGNKIIMATIFIIAVIVSYKNLLQLLDFNRGVTLVLAMCVAALSIIGLSNMFVSFKENGNSTNLSFQFNVILLPYIFLALAIIAAVVIRFIDKILHFLGKRGKDGQSIRKNRKNCVKKWTNANAVKLTNTAAERHAGQLQEEVNRGKPDRPSIITLRDFIEEHETLMQRQVAYSTLVGQVRALKLFEKFIGGSTVLTSIQPRQAEAFVANRLSSDVSVTTVNKDIRTLKRIFNLAIDPRGYLHENQNPFLKIKQRRKASSPLRYVTVPEYKKLLESTDDLWWKTLIAIAYGSGLRREEILNLIWSDIDFDKRKIKVTAKQQAENTIEWEPKDHEMRVLPMTEQASQFLADLQLLCPEGHPYSFISPARLRQIKGRIKQGTWNTCQFRLFSNL